MEENQIIVDVGLDAFIASLRHLQKQYELNTAALKAMKDAGEEQSDAYITLTQEQKVLRQQMASTEKAMQNEIKMQQAQEGSLVQLRAQLANLNKQYDSMSGMERMGKSGEELQGRIKALHDQILGLEGDTGRMQRNVGNYPEAMKPVTAQLREMTQQLVQLRMEGKANTEEYNELLQKTGQMKDAMMDAQREVKQMASDTSALNSVLAGAQAAAGAFSDALGIMNLTGDKDSETAKELAEAQRKLQAAIAITTGLQAVQNALQKESALMMGVNRVRLLAAAAAQRVYAAATRDAEAAQAAFNKVAKSNVYVWLAGLILSVAGAIYAFTRGSKEQAEQAEQVNRTLNNQVEILQRLTQGYADINRRVEDNMEAAIESARAQGKSTEEIRQIEDALFKKKKERMDQERKDYEWLNDNLVTYENKYSDTMSKIRALDAQYMDALRQGNAERAQFYQDEINKLGEFADAIKKRLDAVNDFNSRYGQLFRERQAQLDQRKKEDEEAARAAAAAAKQRHEERIAQIRKEREETKKAFDEMMANLKTAEQLADQRVADNKTIADNVRNVLDHIGLLETAVSELPLKPFEPLTEGLAEVAGAAPSALDQFSASYQENAQAIMETSSALESSFSSVASMYRQMAQDESKSEAERAKAASRAKAWSKIQIATNAGAAVAKGVATAVDVGFPAAIPAMATMTAAILSAIAQAKALLAEAHEHGGVIGGKFVGATIGSDNVLMTGRRGELVLNADQQKRLYDIANGSASSNLTASLVEAFKAMPAPVLVYSELKRFENSVDILDELSNLN